jgi:hypothetical protein
VALPPIAFNLTQNIIEILNYLYGDPKKTLTLRHVMSIELFPLNLLIPAEGENDYVSQCRA